jgi:hypothetical protein
MSNASNIKNENIAAVNLRFSTLSESALSESISKVQMNISADE